MMRYSKYFANESGCAELWFCLYFIDDPNSALIRVVLLFEVFEMDTRLSDLNVSSLEVVTQFCLCFRFIFSLCCEKFSVADLENENLP